MSPLQEAVTHLTPEHWRQANRLLASKALAEFSHERMLTPELLPSGRYRITSDDGSVEYQFAARVLALEHWIVDAASITKQRGSAELSLDAVDLVCDLRGRLGLGEGTLAAYLEEITSTLARSVFQLAESQPTATELARGEFQRVEAAMTEGHPCFVANSGRIGFDAAEYHRYAPETAHPLRLVWLAAHRESCTFSAGADVDYDTLIRGELPAPVHARFARKMEERALDLSDFFLVPVHPWQWWNQLATTFAGEIAEQRLVCLGEGDDTYRPQQSIRTLFNTSDPARHYVKIALSVRNMGFVRGLSAEYMAATPAINDWVTALVEGDETLRATGFTVIRERAAVGYHHRQYTAATSADSPYRKMLAALWRESPVPKLRRGERAATMAALLHVDRAGGSVAGELIAESGLSAEVWLRRYLEAYLVPLLHCFYAHDLVFMPHGENVILALLEGVPQRIFIKDIGEEIAVMNRDVWLPPEVSRVRAEVPEEMKVLSLFTDVFDCFFRFLSGILDEHDVLCEQRFWATVAACVFDYQSSHPELAERFARYDLFAERFTLSCLNRLQLRDTRQMVDLQDPAGSVQQAGTLRNPLAAYAPCQ